MPLNQFPVSSQLGFLKASKLGFRITRGSQGFYQQISFYSAVAMHGYISFLSDPATPSTFDDKLYNRFKCRVSISNFPNSSYVEFIRTITPGAGTLGSSGDVESLVFFPSEAVHLANQSMVDPLPTLVTVKTATSMTQTFTPTTGGLAFTQQFDLTNLLVDPDGFNQSIRVWEHLMLNNLATLRPAIEAQQASDIAGGLYTNEDIWDLIWTIQDNGTHFGGPDAKTILFSGGLISDNPPTGNLPGIDGKIIQIQRGVNAASDPIFIDLLGVESANYYPGSKPADRAFLWPTYGGDSGGRMAGLLPQYSAPDFVYFSQEQLYCSEKRHRIHNSPVYTVLDSKTLQPGFLGLLGPDTYERGPGVLASGFPVDEFGRVQFDLHCPADVISGFFGDPATAQKYWTFQIYEHDATTNINGFIIPP